MLLQSVEGFRCLPTDWLMVGKTMQTADAELATLTEATRRGRGVQGGIARARPR